MNTLSSLSSLPPAAFAELAARAATPAAAGLAPDQARMAGFPALDDAQAQAAPLHVGPAGNLAIDDIERCFIAALCQPPSS